MEETSSLFQRFLRTYQKNGVILEERVERKEMFVIHHGKVSRTPEEDMHRALNYALSFLI